MLGFYAGGSLASGDFQPGRSDLDLVAVIAAELDDRQRRQLRTLHEQTLLDPSAAKLHCVYVPVGNVEDVAAKHVTWAHGTLFQREFSGIGRAELLQAGITVLGPESAELLPPVDVARPEQRLAGRCACTGPLRSACRGCGSMTCTSTSAC